MKHGVQDSNTWEKGKQSDLYDCPGFLPEDISWTTEQGRESQADHAGLIKLKKQIWEYRKSKGARIYEEERAQQKNTKESSESDEY